MVASDAGPRTFRFATYATDVADLACVPAATRVRHRRAPAGNHMSGGRVPVRKPSRHGLHLLRSPVSVSRKVDVDDNARRAGPWCTRCRSAGRSAPMTMIAMVSAKAAPGVTTTMALLATVWPGPVVIADADPAGGDLTTGWLAESSVRGLLYPDRSVLSFAIETRRLGDSGRNALEPHLQPVTGAPHCLLLAGLTDPAQIRFMDPAAWHRLAAAFSDLGRRQSSGADVLIDCGRFGPHTPIPLLCAADLVLVAARPQLRYTNAARCLTTQLRSIVDPARIALAACAASTFHTLEMERRIGIPVGVELPDDRRVASVFSDGGRRPVGFRRSRLVRTATRNALWLHETLDRGQSLADTDKKAG